MTSSTRCLALLLLLSIPFPATATAAPIARWPRIRFADPFVAALFARGSSSPAFAALRDRVEQSDVIVTIDRQPCRGRGHAGTQFITEAGGFRYVRVTLRVERAGDAEAALLGHELQHVVELIEASEVRDQVGYEALYQRIGAPSACRAAAPCFDTADAREAGMTVLRELRGDVTPRGRTRSSW